MKNRNLIFTAITLITATSAAADQIVTAGEVIVYNAQTGTVRSVSTGGTVRDEEIISVAEGRQVIIGGREITGPHYGPAAEKIGEDCKK